MQLLVHFICNLCACGKSTQVFPVFFRKISTRPINIYFRHWYQVSAVWLEMTSFVTSLLMILIVGRPSWLLLLVMVTHLSLSLEKCKLLFIVLTSYAKEIKCLLYCCHNETEKMSAYYLVEGFILSPHRGHALHLNTERSSTLYLAWLWTFQPSPPLLSR